MATRRNSKVLIFSLLALEGACLLLLMLFSTRSTAYSSPAAAPSRPYQSYTPTYAPGTPTPTEIWPAFQLRTPFAYTTPFPASTRTALDGSYAKLDPSEPQWWVCRRCADYRPAGGAWKLNLDRGVFRIYYTVTGWRSLGSYTVDGNQLYLFNDPFCPGMSAPIPGAWRTVSCSWRRSKIDALCTYGRRTWPARPGPPASRPPSWQRSRIIGQNHPAADHEKIKVWPLRGEVQMPALTRSDP